MSTTHEPLTPLEIELLPIPASLRDIPQWGAWRYELQNGKPKKPAFCTRTHKLAPSRPEEWLPLAEAVELVINPANEFKGLGFCFGGKASICGIDFDHCRDKETGKLGAVEHQIITRLDSYTEVSPSGTGAHTLVNAKLSGMGKRGAGIEVYCEGRYFTVTGNHQEGTPSTVNDRQAVVDNLVNAMPIIAKLRADDSKRAPFEALFAGDTSPYGHDASRADLALCSMAAWADATDEQIDALVRLSGLYRDKWERSDYRLGTIAQTCTKTGEAPPAVPAPQQTKTPQWGGVVRRLSDVPLRQPRWIWKPILPRGFLAILAGDGGCGKSTVASLIAARLTRGEHPYTGEPTGKPETVIIATSEDDHSMMLKPRLMAYGADQDRIVTVMPIPAVQQPEQWERLLDDFRPALVIIDPIQEALGGRLDENKASQTRAALRPLLPLVERYDCTILFIAHLGKDATEKKAQHRVLGSVDIGAVMRSIMIIEESEPTGHYTIAHVKGNLAGKGESLAYRIVPHEIEPGWEVGMAIWQEDHVRLYTTKQEQGASLARSYVEGHGGTCERTELEAYLAQQRFSGGTLKRAITDAGLHTTKGMVSVHRPG